MILPGGKCFVHWTIHPALHPLEAELWRGFRFSAKMVELCGEFNMPLAENCAQAEKAFQLQTRGTVLGVGFDSRDMSWFFG